MEAYSAILKRVPRKVARGTHVCGRLSENLISMLVEIERLDFLNHEFHDTPANLRLPWKRLLDVGDKFLSPGVFSSRRPVVEGVDEILMLARRVIRGVGVERVNVFTGDCGLGGLRGVEGAYRISLEKLGNLAKSVKLLNEEFDFSASEE